MHRVVKHSLPGFTDNKPRSSDSWYGVTKMGAGDQRQKLGSFLALILGLTLTILLHARPSGASASTHDNGTSLTYCAFSTGEPELLFDSEVSRMLGQGGGFAIKSLNSEKSVVNKCGRPRYGSCLGQKNLIPRPDCRGRGNYNRNCPP
ncbi:hypothetical protein CIPAW_03G194000 [Carya illinoinensis]|uniref:Uncharacterized protein n=1 Tax=Carya illinoinensis TaxID=32201 RepID=A0A8T1R371_CARIL|nr:hypothetical protein CIPAW_03G194000 [Carya illinoinensis]